MDPRVTPESLSYFEALGGGLRELFGTPDPHGKMVIPVGRRRPAPAGAARKRRNGGCFGPHFPAHDARMT